MVAIVLAACGGEQVAEVREQPMRWVVWRVNGPHEVTLRGWVGHCVDEPEPFISRKEVQYEGRKVYIGLIARRPPDRSDEFLCAGVGLPVDATVRLRRKVSNSVLVDSSKEPPVQRWPRG